MTEGRKEGRPRTFSKARHAREGQLLRKLDDELPYKGRFITEGYNEKKEGRKEARKEGRKEGRL